MPDIHSSPKQIPQGTPTESIKPVKQVKQVKQVKPATPPKPPKPATTTIRLGLKDTLKLCVKHFWYGVEDAFAWPSSLIIIYMSNTIRNRALKCFTLNGIIFLGSIALFNNLTLPILHFFLGNEGAEEGKRAGGENSPFVAIILGWLVKLTYLLFWIYPVFLLSFVLNAMWYQQIADRAYRLQYGQPSNQQLTYSRLPKVLADEIYRALLLMNYLIVATLVYVIPIIGPVLSFMFICWIYAFYSFEYKWTAKRWNLEQRIDYFEERWAYFAGFGFLFTGVTFFVNKFFSAGIFAMVFPVYIIMASNAQPRPRNDERALFSRYVPYKLPVFWIAKKLNNKVISCLGRRGFERRSKKIKSS